MKCALFSSGRQRSFELRRPGNEPDEAVNVSQRTDSSMIGSLAERYRVVGELRAANATRRFVAMRRDGDGEVVIDIVKSTGGVGNELPHLAADVQLLTTMGHPKVPRMIEGRWLDASTYAAVSERIKGDTLQERLDRGERPGTAEVATILNDVKAVLDWAREGGIVHRGVTPDSIIIENDTNRLMIALGLTHIPLSGLPDEVADTRTIGAVAWSLFTGRRFVDGEPRPSLADLCPNLAARVVDATERVLRARPGDRAPDAAAFIGIVAVGDVLKQAEVQFAALDEEFASHFADAPPASGPPTHERRRHSPSRARESLLAVTSVIGLLLVIALGIELATRGRHATGPVVAQQMPTIPAAGTVDSTTFPMRNDSILMSGSANGQLVDSLLRLRDSLVRDSILRAQARRLPDTLDIDSLGRDPRRDSLDEDSFRADSIRNSVRDLIRRDSTHRDSLRRGLLRFDGTRPFESRPDSLRRDSILRSIRRRDSIRPDTSPARR